VAEKWLRYAIRLQKNVIGFVITVVIKSNLKMKNLLIPDFGELCFTSPTKLQDFDNIICNIDFKGNDSLIISLKDYLKNLPNEVDEETIEWKIFLASFNGEIIGITGWYIFKDSPYIAWLTWFGVINKYQKRKIGLSLLRHTIDTIREETNASCMQVYCINDLIPFYNKNGFKLLGKAGEMGMTNKCESDSDNVMGMGMKLYGKELDDELAKRKQAKENRILLRMTMKDYAEKKGISVIDLLAYERGENICSHEEYTDVADFHMRFVFKICKKCGKIIEESIERLEESNLDRIYNVYKEIKENKDLDKN
jgi:GNAT superfamily N-acetyltransferase